MNDKMAGRELTDYVFVDAQLKTNQIQLQKVERGND